MMKENKMLPLGLTLTLFLTPLLFDRRIASAFQLPQTWFLRTAVGALLLAWLWEALRRGKIEISKSPLHAPVLGFLGACTLSTLLSPDPFTSFFGSYPLWFWGLWSIAAYAGLYLLVLSSPSHHGHFIQAAVISSLIASLYGIAQSLGLDPWTWKQAVVSRPASSLGNPNYLGAFSAMMTPICLYSFLSGKINSGDKVRTWLAGAAFCANIYACLLSLTRGSWLGLLAGMGLWMFILRGTLPSFKKRLLPLLMVCLLALGVSVLGTQGENSSHIQERMRVLLSSKEPSAAARLSLWKSSLRIFKDHPLTGVGLDAFGQVFPRYQQIAHARLGGRLMVATNSHNEPLQVASTTGFLGLAMYLWLWICAFRLFFRSLRPRAQTDEETRLLLASLAASCLALEIHSFFNFSISATSAYLWCWLGILASATGKEKVQRDFPPRQAVPAMTLALAVFSLLSYRALRYYQADMSFKRGQSWQEMRQWEKALRSYEDARYQEARYYPSYIRMAGMHMNLAQSAAGEEKGRRVEDARRICAEAYRLFPGLPESAHNLGMAYLQIHKSLGRPVSGEAVKYLKESVQTAPMYPEFWTNYGKALDQAGRSEEAKQAWTRALEIFPSHSPAMETLFARLPKKQVLFYQQEIEMKDVPLGQKVEITDSRGQTFKLMNLEEENLKIRLHVLSPEETPLLPPKDFEPAEEVSWLSLDQKEIGLEPSSISKITGSLFLPDRRALKGKKLSFVIFAQIPELHPRLGAYARLNVETSKQGRSQ